MFIPSINIPFETMFLRKVVCAAMAPIQCHWASKRCHALGSVLGERGNFPNLRVLRLEVFVFFHHFLLHLLPAVFLWCVFWVG